MFFSASIGTKCSNYGGGSGCLHLSRPLPTVPPPTYPDPCLLHASFQVLGEPKQNRKLVAEVSMQNPLSVPLIGCCFTVEGAGLTKEQLRVEM